MDPPASRDLRHAAAFCGDLPSRRPSRRGTFLLAHSTMATDIELVLRHCAQTHPGEELEVWEADWQIAMRIGSRAAVVPDARLVYRVGRPRLHAFVEVDLGTEGTKFFARKIARYVALFGSGDWRHVVPVLPLVLTVTPHDARAASLCGAAKAALRSRYVLPQAVGVFRFISIDELGTAADALAVPWRVAGEDERRPLLDPELRLSRTDALSEDALR